MCQCRRPGFDPWVRKIPLEKGMATHSGILAWRIQRTEEVWWVAVHWVAKSQITSEWLTTTSDELQSGLPLHLLLLKHLPSFIFPVLLVTDHRAQSGQYNTSVSLQQSELSISLRPKLRVFPQEFSSWAGKMQPLSSEFNSSQLEARGSGDPTPGKEPGLQWKTEHRKRWKRRGEENLHKCEDLGSSFSSRI